MSLERTRERGVVDFVTGGFGVNDFVQEFAIIGHQQKSRGVLVETADAVEAGIAMSEAFGQKIIDR